MSILSVRRQIAAAIVLLAAAVPAHGQAAGGNVARGEYLSRIMDCAGCHTNGSLIGQPQPDAHLGGSEIGFAIPDLGVFFPSNLTPDPEYGLGRWSEAEIIAAIRTGTRPDGRMLAPAMPWRSYAVLSDADAADLVAYLKSLPPVRRQAPAPVGPDGKPGFPYLTVQMP